MARKVGYDQSVSPFGQGTQGVTPLHAALAGGVQEYEAPAIGMARFNLLNEAQPTIYQEMVRGDSHFVSPNC